MSTREFQQIITMALSATIAIAALVSCKLKPERKFSHITWFLYGLVGIVFYVVTFLSDVGHIYSPIRSLIQNTLVASQLIFHIAKNIQRRFG